MSSEFFFVFTSLFSPLRRRSILSFLRPSTFSRAYLQKAHQPPRPVRIGFSVSPHCLRELHNYIVWTRLVTHSLYGNQLLYCRCWGFKWLSFPWWITFVLNVWWWGSWVSVLGLTIIYIPTKNFYNYLGSLFCRNSQQPAKWSRRFDMGRGDR